MELSKAKRPSIIKICQRIREKKKYVNVSSLKSYCSENKISTKHTISMTYPSQIVHEDFVSRFPLPAYPQIPNVRKYQL